MDLEAQIKPHSNDLPHQIVIDTLRFANCAPTQKETSCLYYSKLLRRVWKFSDTDKIPNFDHLNESHALKDKEIISYIIIFPLFWVQTKLIEFPCLTPVQRKLGTTTYLVCHGSWCLSLSTDSTARNSGTYSYYGWEKWRKFKFLLEGIKLWMHFKLKGRPPYSSGMIRYALHLRYIFP